VSIEARGVFLDLKAVRDSPPVVLGVAIDDTFEQIVVDTAFGDAALAKDLRVNHLEDEVRSIVARCRSEDRIIFAFSRNVLDGLERFTCSADAVADLYEEAQQLARLWHEKTSRQGTRDWDLAEYLADLGTPQPRHLGTKHTTSRLRYVEQQLRKHDAYDAISGGAKAKWTKLLQQSRSDTLGVRELTLHAARGLAEA
jgi:hypothetical protein